MQHESIMDGETKEEERKAKTKELSLLVCVCEFTSSKIPLCDLLSLCSLLL